MIQEPKQLGIPRHEAVKVFGGNRPLFRKCEKAGWIKSVGGTEGRAAVFDYANIENAWKRLSAGETPNFQ